MNPVLGKKNEEQRLNLADGTQVVCEKCGCQIFEIVFKMVKISAIISPSGQETYIPIQLFACKECSHINKEFLKHEAE